MKEQKKIKDKWLHLRLSEEEQQQIKALFEASTTGKLCEYARQVLLSKPIYKGYVDVGQQDFIKVLTKLKKEINSIGNNFNQVVKKLHTLPDKEAEKLLISYELEKRLLVKKVEEVQSVILKTAAQWLQK